MIDIPEYEGLYQYDTELEKVYNIKKNRYLKNTLDKGSLHVRLSKNGKVKKYTIRQLFYICNPIENNNLVSILDYDNYQFDLELSQVYNLKTNMYLKNCLNDNGYYQVGLYKNGKEKKYGLHQLIYLINNPTENIIGFAIDHIDGNRTNNKIENLRKCSPSDNCSNRKTPITNKSTGIKYIYKNKYNTYTFQLVKNKINYNKTFKTIEESIKHRDRVVREVCGEYANLG